MIKGGIMKLLYFFVALLSFNVFAQANICTAMWWETATDVQVEVQAEWYARYQPEIAKTVINADCPRNYKPDRSAFMVAIRNSRNLDTLQAVFENFDVTDSRLLSALSYAESQFVQTVNLLAMRFVSLSGHSILADIIQTIQPERYPFVTLRDPFEGHTLIKGGTIDESELILNFTEAMNNGSIDMRNTPNYQLRRPATQQEIEDLSFYHQLFLMLMSQSEDIL